MSTPVSAAPSVATPFKIDFNGEGTGQTGRTQPTWQAWDFDRAPTTNVFTKAFTVGGDKVSVELRGIKNDGSNPGGRNRATLGPSELGQMHQDLFFVATTGSGVGLAGKDYIQVKLSLGSAYANKTYKITTWAWDTAFNTFHDSSQDDYSAWGVVNPNTNGGYRVTMWDDPATTDVNEAGIYKCNVPTLARGWMGVGAPPSDPTITAYTYSSSYTVMTDGTGAVTIYGWWDGDRWQGSYHFPINGLMMVPEPTTVALLGLGGLALLRRRK